VVAGEFNAGVNGFKTIEDGGGFKRIFKGGKWRRGGNGPVAPEAWSWAVLDGQRAVVARALFDEGDDPGLTDRVVWPVREREATTESDKWSRRWPKRTSVAGDGRNRQSEQATGRLGRTGREEVGRSWARK
jgi:hypothetical protein